MFREIPNPRSFREVQNLSRIWPRHVEKVFPIVRKIYEWKPTDDVKDLDVNTAIWCIFMSDTLQAAVHLVPENSMNFRSVEKSIFEVCGAIFRTSGVSSINWDQRMWSEPSLLCHKGISPEPVEAWEDTIKWYLETRYLKELDRIDREQMEFEWKALH